MRISEARYFDILERKTAFLFAGCCEIGAILGGADREAQSAMRDYGMNLGIAFQLVDDLLDFTSDQTALGKAAATDLLEGKLTLPLIKLAQAEPSFVPELEAIMLKGAYDDAFREVLMHKLKHHDLLDETRSVANSYADTARKKLEILSRSAYRDALDEIPNFVIERNN